MPNGSTPKDVLDDRHRETPSPNELESANLDDLTPGGTPVMTDLRSGAVGIKRSSIDQLPFDPNKLAVITRQFDLNLQSIPDILQLLLHMRNELKEDVQLLTSKISNMDAQIQQTLELIASNFSQKLTPHNVTADHSAISVPTALRPAHFTAEHHRTTRQRHSYHHDLQGGLDWSKNRPDTGETIVAIRPSSIPSLQPHSVPQPSLPSQMSDGSESPKLIPRSKSDLSTVIDMENAGELRTRPSVSRSHTSAALQTGLNVGPIDVEEPKGK